MKKILYIVVAFVGLALVARFAKDDSKKEVTTVVAEKQVKGIDGLSPVDIYLDLEKKGYIIDKQYTPNEGTMYYCDKKDYAITYNVTMFKNTDDKVEEVKISASLTGLDNKNIVAVKPFLKYISTVQYEGSDANKVTQWIEDNFNKDGASIIIGKAKFSIHGNKFSKVVLIEQA